MFLNSSKKQVVTDEIVEYYRKNPNELDLLIDKEDFNVKFLNFIFVVGLAITIGSRVLAFYFEEVWGKFINNVVCCTRCQFRNWYRYLWRCNNGILTRIFAEDKIDKLGLEINLDLYDGHTFPYADNSFDKVFSSLVFHQLDQSTKLSSLKEIYRVLKPNGTLIIGDWGEAKNKLMRFTFYFVQMLDGFKTTDDNVKGLLPSFIKQAGFKDVAETNFINTRLGTYSYYQATK